MAFDGKHNEKSTFPTYPISRKKKYLISFVFFKQTIFPKHKEERLTSKG